MSKMNTSSSSSRILRVSKVLCGYALSGISSGKLVAALHESPANANRALNISTEGGLTLKLENGYLTLGVQLLQIVMTHSNEAARTQDCINEINQRVISDSRL